MMNKIIIIIFILIFVSCTNDGILVTSDPVDYWILETNGVVYLSFIYPHTNLGIPCIYANSNFQAVKTNIIITTNCFITNTNYSYSPYWTNIKYDICSIDIKMIVD